MTSLAILADENAIWKPRCFSYTQWGCKIDFQFPIVKLKELGKDMGTLLADLNPFAVITAAHLLTQTSRHDVQSRYDWKWKLTRMLYEKDYTRKQILNLYRFIDWLMVLPESLSKKFNDQHKEYEEGKKMPFITTAERIGREEGMEKGMLEDAREMVLEALDIRFSNIPEDIHKQIKALNNRMLLKRLLASAIKSKDIEGFKKTIQEISSEPMP